MSRRKKEGKRAYGIQAKKGMLYIVITRGKKKEWMATGLKDTPDNVKLAIKEREELLAMGRGRETNRDITLEEYVDRYLKKKKRIIADTTYAGYLHRANRIKEFFLDWKVRRINTDDVESFLDSLFLERHLQPRTVRDIKAFFYAVMESAIKDGLLTHNPVNDATIDKNLEVKYARIKEDGSDFFSYQEAQMFLKLVENHELYELFYFTLFFGLRREEVLGIKWSSINFLKNELSINHTVTKGTGVNRLNATKTVTSERTYPLNEDQLMVLKHLKQIETKNKKLFGSCYQDNDYVFKHKDGALYYPDYPSKAFSKIIKENPELPKNTTFHGLRASCVSILVHEGFDVKRIQKWAGHADIETTLKIYAKVKDKESKQELSTGLQELIKLKKYENE